MKPLDALHAFLALLGHERSVGALANAEFARELEGNVQLRASSPASQEEARAPFPALVRERAKLLRTVLFLSFFSMASAVAVAVAVWYTKIGIPTSTQTLSIASAFCFAWATLGRLGWSGQSWSGRSSVEQLDQLAFHVLYWLGMYFATAAAL